MQRRWVVVAALGVTLAGCGDASETPSSASGAASEEPAGTIKVMASVPSAAKSYAYPEVADAVKAGVNALNEAGGIKGYEIDLEICDNRNSPAAASQCAQQAVKDDVVAMVGNFSFIGGTAFYPVLDGAGIPSIGNGPSNPADWTEPMSYPVLYAPQAVVAAGPFAMAEVGCEKVSVLGFEDPAFEPYFGFAAAGVEAAGMEMGGEVEFPADTKDFTAAAAEVVGQGSDCAFSLGPAGVIAGQVRALRASGEDITLGGVNTLADNLDEMGSALDGSPFAEATPTPSFDPPADAPEELKRFAAELEASGYTEPRHLGTNALGGWLAVQLFAQAANAIPAGEVTPATLVEALDRTDFRMPGVVGASDFAGAPPVAEWPRLRNWTMFLKVVEDGQRQPLPKDQIDLAPLFQELTGGA